MLLAMPPMSGRIANGEQALSQIRGCVLAERDPSLSSSTFELSKPRADAPLAFDAMEAHALGVIAGLWS